MSDIELLILILLLILSGVRLCLKISWRYAPKIFLLAAAPDGSGLLYEPTHAASMFTVCAYVCVCVCVSVCVSVCACQCACQCARHVSVWVSHPWCPCFRKLYASVNSWLLWAHTCSYWVILEPRIKTEYTSHV